MEAPEAGESPWAALGVEYDDAIGVLTGPMSKSLKVASATCISPSEALAALRAPTPPGGYQAAMATALASSVDAYSEVLPTAVSARERAKEDYLDEFDRIIGELTRIDGTLATCEKHVGHIVREAAQKEQQIEHSRKVEVHVSTFVSEAVLEPTLVRHIVDGRVGDEEYLKFLGILRKKAAFFDMKSTKNTAAYGELKPVLDRLLTAAGGRVGSFLLSKIALLRRPRTNVQIIKQNVLLKYKEMVHFLDELCPAQYSAVHKAYVDTMAVLYHSLFRQYTTSLIARKAYHDADPTDALVGTLPQQSAMAALSARTFASFLQASTGVRGNTVVTGGDISSASATPRAMATSGRDGPSQRRLSTGTASSVGAASLGSPRRQSAAAATIEAGARMDMGPLVLGNRIDVLAKVDSRAIVLAVAESNDLRFYYEEIHRSLGRMLSETCASERAFCEAFFGELSTASFDAFFKPVTKMLIETVGSHADSSHDMIGCLLALKVNEAQRTSMLHRQILDLSDYFIRVDIALKPKFKRLFDMNVASLRTLAQDAQSVFKGDADTTPHLVTRRFADLSSAVLRIASYGATDDAILEGLRRMRTEFCTLLTAISVQYTNTKARYVFLINNIDLVLSTYTAQGVEACPDARQFAELQVGHTAAYVEQEVADHLVDLVSIVRDHERREKFSGHSETMTSRPSGAPTEQHVRAILREFSSNWHLGVQHMRENVLRSFPNFKTGDDILRALFARMMAYHRRCESAVRAHYPALVSELVSGTEIAYEIRQLSRTMA